MVEMELLGVQVEMPSETPMLLLLGDSVDLRIGRRAGAAD